MRCDELKLTGAYLLSEQENSTNSYGFDLFYDYSRMREISKLRKVFSAHYEVAFTHKNTLRGFYIQNAPYTNNIMFRCVRGRCRIVLLDVRDISATYHEYITWELSAEKNEFLYVPVGVAHAYISLEDDTKMFVFSDNIISELKNVTINAFDILGDSGLIPDGVIASVKERFAPHISEIDGRYW